MTFYDPNPPQTGEPIVVIDQGRWLRNVIRRHQIAEPRLRAQLREQGIVSESEVDSAVLRPNGMLVVLSTRPAASRQADPAAEVIVDGKIIDKTLMERGLSRSWLSEQLRQAGVDRVGDVFYAELQEDGSLRLDRREDLLH